MLFRMEFINIFSSRRDSVDLSPLRSTNVFRLSAGMLNNSSRTAERRREDNVSKQLVVEGKNGENDRCFVAGS